MKVSKIRCIVPFTQMFFMPKGFISTCCPPWTKMGPIGNVFIDKDLMAVWNNKKMTAIRSAILTDRLEETCSTRQCPILASGNVIDIDKWKTENPYLQSVIEQIRCGRTELETGPTSLNMSNSGACNLNCKMCGANSRYLPEDQHLSDILFNRILPPLLPKASEITLTGNGDPFFRKDSREFMFRKNNALDYPHLKIQLITNALLLNKSVWEKISHNRFAHIRVSVDGATKQTYEKIRVNGRWEVLRENLSLVSELRKQGRFETFGLHCVVVKSNHVELVEIARLGIELGCDLIHFIRVSGGVSLSENINFSKNLKILSSIGRILHDPIFNDPRVQKEEIRDYCRYSGLQPSFFSRLRTFVIITFLTIPLRWYYLIRFKLPLNNPYVLRLMRILGKI